MANPNTPDPNPDNEPSRSPLMLIVMAVIIILGILAFLFLHSGGAGKGTESSPANHQSQQHSLPAMPSTPAQARYAAITSLLSGPRCTAS